MSVAEAWTRAARAAGFDVGPGDVTVASIAGGWRLLRVAGLAEPQSARLVALPTGAGAVPAYETVVAGHLDGVFHGYLQFVHARTGRVLIRESLVHHGAENPEWEVFPAYPHLALDRYPWNYPSADIRDRWCWFPKPGCQLAVANPAARVPWDSEAPAGAPTFTTIGNAADSQEEWESAPPHTGPGPNQYRPTSPDRTYVYPWTNEWFNDPCNPDNLTVPGVSNDISAAVTNLFVGHNRMHDWSYHLGFTEERWNAQRHNFGRPTLENDELDGNAQAGARTGGAPTYSGRDNAFMFTRPDGQQSITSMFLWQPLAGAFYAPCVDGDFDMSVIGHEYTHMIENRMIGKGANRMGFHAGAMGESVSDLTAMEYLNEYNFVPVSGEDPWAVGAYVTGDDVHGIRNYNMSHPSAGHFPQPAVFPDVNPLNFSDVGYDLTGPQVHADGEIWTTVNFDIRELLLGRYPSNGARHQRECADGERPAQECPGNRRWIQLLFDSYLLDPTAPTFLDARDSILAADLMRFGGANQDLLWLAFARRGFGEHAATTGTQDNEPTPDFESPLHDEATVVFNAVSETGQPVNANIFVGHYEARVSPIGDTNPATAGQNRDNVARFVEDDPKPQPNSRVPSYEFVANAPGYGHIRFRLNDVKPGETRQVTIVFPTNVASRHQGASATGDGTRHDDLIDDTEGTNWESDGPPVQGLQVLVDLAGGAQTFRQVKVSAHLFSGQNRFTALRSFELYACTVGGDRRNPACDPTQAGGFRRILKSHNDAFPGSSPRVVGPELILRTFEVPTTTATHVLLRVVDNQCTGNSEYHGEQDNDPANGTDCRVGGPLPPRNTTVRAAELQVLTARPSVIGANTQD
ncbi:MAG: M36 family metallopeptidase [Actinomycetota bacterium]|nr:M36 family metallopeptidase [Actinomycetota bacterium]